MYNPELLPITKNDDVTNKTQKWLDVEVQHFFLKLMRFDMETQTMQVMIWFQMEWVDDRLKWDPEAYLSFLYKF